MFRYAVFTIAISCSGGNDEAPAVRTNPADEACYHVAEGTILDGGASPEDAPVLEAGIDPYRVGLVPDDSTFVWVDTDAGELVLLSDLTEAFASLQTDGVDVSLPAAAANPACDQDILSMVEVTVDSGEHLLELAPSYKATMWLTVALR